MGCSTLALASGLRDQRRQKHLPFVTCDAFPAGLGETESPVRFIKHAPNDISLLVWGKPMYRGLVDSLYRDFFEPVFNKPAGGGGGSVLHWLYTNLYTHGLHENVTIVAGGSQNYPPLDYYVVWTDAAHDMTEIKRNERVGSLF